LSLARSKSLYLVGRLAKLYRMKYMTVEIILERLMRRRQHLLCLLICEYIRHDASFVLLDWAKSKILYSIDTEEETLKAIELNLAKRSEIISYAEIATTAFENGKFMVAKRLLDLEKRVDKQVPLLLEMNEYEVALKKACESQDPDTSTPLLQISV